MLPPCALLARMAAEYFNKGSGCMNLESILDLVSVACMMVFVLGMAIMSLRNKPVNHVRISALAAELCCYGCPPECRKEMQITGCKANTHKCWIIWLTPKISKIQD